FPFGYQMRRAEFINLGYFLLFTVFATVCPLPSASRRKAILIGLSGLALTPLALVVVRAFIRDWWPVVLIPLVYWHAGCFFQKANRRLQAIFDRSDRRLMTLLRLNLTRLSRTRFGGFLELMYVLCYPVVPLGLAGLYLGGFRHAADAYWTVVL